MAITAALNERGALAATGGVRASPKRRAGDPLSGPLGDRPYQLGPAASETFEALGLDLPALLAARSRRPLLRFCMDWTEQRPHLAGRLGAALTESLIERGWLTRQPHQRAVRLTKQGVRGLADELDLRADRHF